VSYKKTKKQIFTAETQRAQRFSDFYFPVRGRKIKKALLRAVYIFLPSQQKYIITLSAISASLR
jgi:hypothetical protein